MATTTLRDPSRILIPAGLGFLVLAAAVPCGAQFALPPQFVVETADGQQTLFLVRPETFLDFTTWEYYGQDGWSGDVHDLAELTTRVSSELGVTPMPEGSGRWVQVFQEDAIGRYVSLRIGESPVGPWSRIHRIYRPRFIRIRVDDGTALREDAPTEGWPVLAAAPNPFNPRTEVSFRLDEAQPVTVSGYDVAGRLVKTLADGALGAGSHTLTWDGRDHTGRTCPAGIYFCACGLRRRSQGRRCRW